MRGGYCGQCRPAAGRSPRALTGEAFYFDPTLDVIEAMTFEAILN
jgi:hypothetical protein